MSKTRFYHNPKCSKSREALAFVKEQVSDVEIIDYIKNPLSKQELEDIFEKLSVLTAHEMIRDQEKEFAMAGLTNKATNDEVLDAVAKYPKLLERPIVVHKKRAAIGRPLDHIVSLLHD